MTANTSKTPTLWYTVQEHKDRQYHHLTIRIWQPSNNDIDRFLKTGKAASFYNGVSLRWQGNAGEEDPTRWYGLDVDFPNSEYLDSLKQALAILRKVAKDDNYLEPDYILDRLAKIGQFLIDDPRLSSLVVTPRHPKYSGWIDDCDRYDNKSYGCNARVLAETEEDAQREVNRAFIAYAAETPYSYTGDSYINWVNSGKPVKKIYLSWSHNDADYRTPAEMLKKTPREDAALLAQYQRQEAHAETL